MDRIAETALSTNSSLRYPHAAELVTAPSCK
jgi:hypothetical protein